MAKPVDKKFSWVIEKFSSFQSWNCYSVPGLISGCKWRLYAPPEGNNGDYLSLYLCVADSESLPCGWRRYVKLRLTVVNQLSRELSVVKEGQRCKEVNQAADTSSSMQNSENAASQEGSDDDGASEEDSDDDGASEESADDDGSKEGQNDDDSPSLGSEDGSREKGSLKDGSLTLENCVMRCNSVASKTEVSNVDNDDAPIEDPGDDDVIENEEGDDNASSLVSGVSDRDVASLNKSEDASQREEDGEMKCNKVSSVTDVSNDFPKEVKPVKETKDVNGFQVFSSQVELVSHIFKRHPDVAEGFRQKNKEIRRAYMNELLSLIDMLCQSPEKLSEDDLSNADDTL